MNILFFKKIRDGLKKIFSKYLERDKIKLRRKYAIVAKKKVALYGVNNYVDIDKDKAEKLAQELELLEILKICPFLTK